jgi:hypothetical protein
MAVPAHLDRLLDLVVEAVVRDIEAETQIKKPADSPGSAAGLENHHVSESLHLPRKNRSVRVLR